jgi:hypothetical protein
MPRLEWSGTKSDEERRTEYEICLRRGHEPTGVQRTVGWSTWQHCKWCGTDYLYRETVECEEQNAPQETTA